MNLKEDITNLINSYGIEESAKHFGKSPSTVKVWLKTGAFPIDVVQEYLNMHSTVEEATPDPVEEGLPAPSIVTATQEPVDRLSALEGVVGRIEQYLVQLNQSQPTAPVPLAPSGPWIPPDPTETNVRSMVRPGAGVPAKASLSTPAAQSFGPRLPVTPLAGLKPGQKPSALWLDPRPVQKK